MLLSVNGDDIWKTVLKAALGSSGCVFDMSWYPSDNRWAKTLDYAGYSIADAIELLDKLSSRRPVNGATARRLDRYVLFTRAGQVKSAPPGTPFRCRPGTCYGTPTRSARPGRCTGF
jgi:hypothetical protein